MKRMSILAVIIVVFTSCKNRENKRGEIHQDAVKVAQDVSINNFIDSDTLISYWDVQRKGANYFNEVPTKEWFESAAEANIKLVRLTYEKWEGEQKDFLLGNADNYKGIVENDFILLKKYLDIANEFDIKVVLTPLSLPGARYTQSNSGKKDGRLWTKDKYLPMALQFWTDLATKLKDHPAIIGYNLINEPFPELFYGKPNFWDANFLKWYETVKTSSGDLNRFNKMMVAAIRKVDGNMPIVIESGLYATPWAFEYLQLLEDDKIIYSFHMYEPYEYTTKKINEGKYTYPGKVKVPDPGGVFDMSESSLIEFLSPITNWTKTNDIPSNRIWVGEFGCDRTMPGATEYLGDLIDFFNHQQWHWAFYSFREDNWSSMDYELGTGRLFWKYWDYNEASTLHLHYKEIYEKDRDNKLWKLFKTEFEID